MNQQDLETLRFLREYSALTETALDSVTMELSRPGATAPGALQNLQRWRTTLRMVQEKRLHNLENPAR